MVNRQLETTSQEGLSPGRNGLDDFNVVDSTSPEQLEIEAELDSELEQVHEPEDAVEVDGEQVRVGRDTEREAQLAAQVQAQQEPEAEEQVDTAPPQVRQYSQEEVSKMQASWMRQVSEAQKQAREAQQARDLETEVEALLRQQERALVAQYGEDEARKLVRNPDNEKEVRSTVRLRQENESLKLQVQQTVETQEAQARAVVARHFMDQYGLQTGDYELLLDTQTPQAMMRLAERLRDQSARVKQQEQKRLARVPAETRNTRLENGASTGSAPETAEKRLNRLRAVPSWEWTDADRRFMQTGRI